MLCNANFTLNKQIQVGHQPALTSYCEQESEQMYFQNVCIGPLLVFRQKFMAVFVLPDVSNLRAVLQVPAVGHFVLPAHVSRVFPQQANLVVGVSCVPQ